MERTALILADDAQGLQRVYGMPAVRRLALLALRLGFERIHLISRDARLAPVVSDLIGTDGFHQGVDEPHLHRTIEKLGLKGEGLVLVLKAGHVIDRLSLERLLNAHEDPEISFLENVDKGSDEPIFLVKASRLLPLLASLRSPEGPEAGIAARAIHVGASPGLPELMDGGREKIRAAESALIAAVGEATRERDSFLSRHVSRRVSRLISPWAARAGMTPNAVTVCNTLLGLGAACLLFLGGYVLQLGGSLLFLLSIILDGVDGEVARIRLQESDFGQTLDVICDNVVHVAVFIGMARGLYHDTANPLFLYLLCLLLGGFGLCALVINRTLAQGDGGPQRSGVAALLEGLLNNRDFAYVVTGFALFHRLDWFLAATAFGTYGLAGTLWAAQLASKRPAGRAS